MDFAEADLARVSRRDSRWNGTLWGLAAGVALGVWLEASLAEEYGRDGMGYGEVLVPLAAPWRWSGLRRECPDRGAARPLRRPSGIEHHADHAPAEGVGRRRVMALLTVTGPDVRRRGDSSPVYEAGLRRSTWANARHLRFAHVASRSMRTGRSAYRCPVVGLRVGEARETAAVALSRTLLFLIVEGICTGPRDPVMLELLRAAAGGPTDRLFVHRPGCTAPEGSEVLGLELNQEGP
jgi:hypothetical protein